MCCPTTELVLKAKITKHVTHISKLHAIVNVSISGKMARLSASGQKMYGFGMTRQMSKNMQ